MKFSLLGLLALAWCASAQIVELVAPPPPVALGSDNAHIKIFELLDTSRIDPFAPEKQFRHLMLTLFQPANCSETTPVPYMPAQTAELYDEAFSVIGIPKGTFASFRLQTCKSAPKNNKFPLLIFSTGYGMSRILYNSINQWVASMGFNVLAIDHPYDASIVEYSDNSTVLAANLTFPEQLPAAIDVRVGDVLFVLDSLANKTIRESVGIPEFNTSRVGIFGHSLGGLTAAQAIDNDTRLVAGLNMDGGIFRSQPDKPMKAPFVIFAAEGHNQTNDDTWATFWETLTGFKLQLEVKGTVHGSFSDYGILAQTMGLSSETLPILTDYIGTLPGDRMLRIIRRYVGAFFHFALQHTDEVLLKGPSKDFPAVSFKNESMGSA